MFYPLFFTNNITKLKKAVEKFCAFRNFSYLCALFVVNCPFAYRSHIEGKSEAIGKIQPETTEIQIRNKTTMFV